MNIKTLTMALIAGLFMSFATLTITKPAYADWKTKVLQIDPQDVESEDGSTGGESSEGGSDGGDGATG